jgi:hypothetical protein
MRNALMAGTAGLLIVLGAAGAANAANPNVPTYSPYTLMYVPGSVPDVERTSKPVMAADQVEGRAAYIDDGAVQPGYRERPATFFPMNLMPWNW